MALKIKPAHETEFDLLALGECMIRLSPPGHQRIELTPVFEAYAGGGEYNVAYALARYGLRTAWVSRLVDNPLGAFIRNHAQASGMNLSEVIWVPYDGVGRADRIGLNFTEVGIGVRPSVTLYDRGHSAASHMRRGEVDWHRLFSRRKVRWFHTGGIFTALSDSCAEVVAEAMQAAHEAGTVVSYDLNFRSKLWSSQRAIAVTKKLVPYVDVLIGNEEDFQKVLGFEVAGTDEQLKTLPVEGYKMMVEKVVTAYPHLGAVGTTLREVVSGLVNNWSAILYYDGQFYQSRRYEHLEIEDRVGGGDGFCSGFVYGLLHGLAPQECVEMGAAHGALLQSTRGDTSMVTLEEIKHVMAGGSARIKR
ncbi:MAG: sugar kinase [candidate division KSB1 bacterium]|nr:sugar kinase [candidate division KSB1 bacterium]MDZ7272565.1 sugar kinase [candidate division KSB1 bacterium]MDZ7284412.1 sugar kinase [candidate division KSB1 bacterium]MDZ7297192.1 sugar kinase [candidate division KSB1 bacterium]MDZ7308099.1 sugar kinase [candidate division KSB1 bacterium]